MTRALVGIIAFIVSTAALIGAIAYVIDAPVEATVTEKGTDDNGRYIIATTHIGNYDVKRYLPVHEWIAIQPGNHVVYHIQSGMTEVYTRQGGTLLWRG